MPAPPTEPSKVGVLPADADLKAGEMVDEYEITGRLGAGGMGTVYAGVQPVIGKRVAIKVLQREYASNPQVVNRFIQEARAVNQVQSRYIVDIFSFGALADGRHYFVMENIEGEALRDYLRGRGTLAFDEAYSILRAVCRGLAAAHEKGIVHRDLKPENIMVVSEDGQPSAKLLDFGIAKLVGSNSNPGFATQTGTAMGTPYYMSPEQVRGVDVDHRTDIYALGIIMFELFTGSLPFNARSYIELVNQHLFAAPPNPRKLSGAVSLELEALILRCIAKDPAQRPQSMTQLNADLDGLVPLLKGTQFSLSQPSLPPGSGGFSPPIAAIAEPAEAPSAPTSRKRSVLPLVVVLALLVGAGVVGGYLLLDRVRSADDAAASTGKTDLVKLRISTRPPGATVFIDQREQPESAPLTVALAPGSYRLVVHLEGYQRVSERVDLESGRDRSMSYVLVPEPAAASREKPAGKLVVRTGEAQASYRLGDAIVGSGASLSMDAVPAGEYDLQITAPGRVALQRKVRISPGGTLDLSLELKRAGSAGRARRSRRRSKRGRARQKAAKVSNGTKSTLRDPDDTLDPFKR